MKTHHAHRAMTQRVIAPLVVLAALLPAATASADDGALYIGFDFGLGGAGFNGYPETEWGWTLNADLGFVGSFDGLALQGGLLYSYIRTADGEGDLRAVTVADFYGATGGVGYGEGGVYLLARGGIGYAIRSVDALPDGDYDAKQADRGVAGLVGAMFIVADGGGDTPALLVGADYIVQFGGAGMSWFNTYIGIGFALGN